VEEKSRFYCGAWPFRSASVSLANLADSAQGKNAGETPALQNSANTSQILGGAESFVRNAA